MGIRQTFNNYPSITAIATIVVIAAAIIYVFQSVKSRDGVATSLYFTTDDGQSYFADSADLIPPFTSGGKEAVLAHVYILDGEKKVAYLERYTPQAKAVIEKFKKAQKEQPAGTDAVSSNQTTAGMTPSDNIAELMNARGSGSQWKLPGEKEWKPAAKRERVRDKSGSAAEEILP